MLFFCYYVVLLFVLLCYYLCCPMYCLCVLYHCHRVLTQLQLTNISIYHSDMYCTNVVPNFHFTFDILLHITTLN